MDCFAKNMGSQTHVFLAGQLSPTIQGFRNIAGHCQKYGPNRYAENYPCKMRLMFARQLLKPPALRARRLNT